MGVPVKIGSVELDRINLWDFDKESDLIVHDIEVLDKNSELLAKVDTASINFKVIALRDDPVAALDVIKLDGATVNIVKRDENSWNFNDIKLESEGESTFGAKVYLERGTVNADFDGKNISVEEISGEADCADMNAIATVLNAKTLGAQVKATGTLGKTQKSTIFFLIKFFPTCPKIQSPTAWKFCAAPPKIPSSTSCATTKL